MIQDWNGWFESRLRKAVEDSVKEFTAEELSELVNNVLSAILPQTAEIFLRSLISRGPRRLRYTRKYRRKFEKRLAKRWKRPFNLLELFLVVNLEAGERFNLELRGKAAEEGDYVFDALTRLHANSCQVGFEVLALLRGGFADGAMARWRTIHESAVIGFFIREHGQEVAERFLNYMVIDTYREALKYQEHSEELGAEPLSDEEFAALKKDRDSMCSVYGEKFGQNYGWTVTVLPRAERNFAGIEKSVGLDLLRPYYKMACSSVHVGSKGMKFKLGTICNDPGREVLLAGPSNYGLTDPAHCTAISLLQITTSLLTLNPNFERLSTLATMSRVVEEIGQAFYEVQVRIEEEEARLKGR